MNEANFKAMMHKTATMCYFQGGTRSTHGTEDISK